MYKVRVTNIIKTVKNFNLTLSLYNPGYSNLYTHNIKKRDYGEN